MSETIQAQVSQGIIERLPKLFNASIDDILIELLQNARRAGATKVEFETEDSGVLVYKDNGLGIPDPQILLSYGESSWENLEHEDPAGMGFLSLASYNVTVRSHEWCVQLTPESFSGLPVEVERGWSHINGVKLFINLGLDQSQIAASLKRAATYRPSHITVTLNGKFIPAEDFLQRAAYIEVWNGLRIGVYRSSLQSKLNFYGVQIFLPDNLGLVNERYSIQVDVIYCPHLKLVLPARKEIYQNEFYQELKAECKKVVFRYIQTQPSHQLAFKHYQHAAELGLPIAEATPQMINLNCSPFTLQPNQQYALLLEDHKEIQYQIRPALPPEIEFINPNEKYKGYSWYNFPTYSLAYIRITLDDGTLLIFDPEESLSKLFYSGEEKQDYEEYSFTQPLDAKDLSVVFYRAHAGNQSYVEGAYSIPYLILGDEAFDYEDGFWNADESCIIVNQSVQTSVTDLENLLMQVFFHPSDDWESDSVETQEISARREARELAMKRLPLEADQLINDIKAALCPFQNLIKTDQSLKIELRGGQDILCYFEGADDE